ncbi:Iron(III)-hydroxamate import system permease protein fhuB [Cedecea davisae]|uniref:Iron(3+)-hydroxamate import system permease protein FhuB n=1 Tax=Cedecea davisae DSM 4568 TaxID=566551 RepID=S3JD38_9ENTR|nr:Fe(3+)-hydroxamate ABC transporter permease FhuB [Cedecea davisae]EPF18082.1 iron(3+)-hydroxamate import system permease protein FhuB [Cedecea davisae DSM 4568]SUX28245.1 Iron(III)-hydroxamate import system permease protein fhuB [Cedecea davisae]
MRLILVLLCAFTLFLTGYNFQQTLSASLWWQAIVAPQVTDVSQMLFHYSMLPRTTLALLTGAGLALAGCLFQHILRNPLAEPATLGVAAGAQLGLTLATLFLAGAGETGKQLAALAGAMAVGSIVLGAAWGKRMSPVTLILAGLVLGLYCGAVKSFLVLFNHERLQNLFIWSSGMLNQYDWAGVDFLWPRLLAVLVLIVLMIRPLGMLALDDAVLRGLGMKLALVRVAGLFLALLLSSMLVSIVGVIGFIGLFAPILAGMFGVRRLLPKLLASMVMGALLLVLSDQLVIWLGSFWQELPTGAVTALVGAPLMLWLLPRLRHQRLAATQDTSAVAERQLSAKTIILACTVLLLVSLLALGVGRESAGWFVGLEEMWQWRWPRVLSALAAGAMLAAAGTLVQKMTGNPMASPEVLGVSSGAACAIVLLTFLVPGDISAWQLPAGFAGAALTLLAMLVLARTGLAPGRLLLTGVALSTVFATLLTLYLASGDPRSGAVLTWLSGSTWKVTGQQALVSGAMALAFIGLTPLVRRWLVILPLGGEAAQALGVALSRSRITILMLAAGLVAAATLCVGPLSFIGLMAPHMARMLGFRRAMPQLVMAIAIGSGLMLVADWLGRSLIFPFQIPAGLLATLCGAPYFIWLLRKA